MMMWPWRRCRLVGLCSNDVKAGKQSLASAGVEISVRSREISFHPSFGQVHLCHLALDTSVPDLGIGNHSLVGG